MIQAEISVARAGRRALQATREAESYLGFSNRWLDGSPPTKLDTTHLTHNVLRLLRTRWVHGSPRAEPTRKPADRANDVQTARSLPASLPLPPLLSSVHSWRDWVANPNLRHESLQTEAEARKHVEARGTYQRM